MGRELKIREILSYEFLILSLIVIVGFALRIYHLQLYVVPGSVDSVGYSYSAFLYSRGGWLSSSATPKGFLFISLMSIFYRVLGPILLSGKLVSLLFGGLIPIITFFLGKELFDKRAGLIGAFIVSINPILILYSCLTFREMLFSFTWMCCIYFALRGFKGNTFYAILGGIFFGLSSMTIEIGVFTGLGFILYYVVQKSLKNRTDVNKSKNLDVLICSAIITMIPLFVRDFLVFGDPLASWVIFPEEVFAVIIRAYIYFLALSVPYVLLFRVLFRGSRLPSVGRFSSVLKFFLIGLVILYIVLVGGYFSGIFSGNFETLAAQSFVGLVKFSEYMTLPEYLWFLLSFFAIVGIIYALKSREARAPSVLCLLVFLFSHIVRAAILSNTIQSYGYSLSELLLWNGRLQPITWPYQIIFRYSFPFIPLFLIFASQGFLFFCDTAKMKLKRKSSNKSPYVKQTHSNIYRKRVINRYRILEIGLISVIIFAILFQYWYAEADLLSRADSHDSYKNPTRPADVELSFWIREGGESLSLIDWLQSQGSPLVYSFNSFFTEKYGEDKVILLTGNENLLDIAKRAREDGVEYIVSDALGSYSVAQYELYRAGLHKTEPRFRGQPIGYYELVRSYSHWHQAQVFKISAPERMALVVQGSTSTGAPWISFLSDSSPSYIVEVVDDEEQLTEYFTFNYDVIVLTEIQRNLENDELALLREKVEEGTILILNGVSPAYVNLNENSNWLGAKNFVEAPKDAKWDMEFEESALNILSKVELNRSYAFYSQSLYSSPTGCTEINTDVTIYATRVEDGAITIFANQYFNGGVIFTGVRHTHASKTIDYGLYLEFIQSLITEII